MLGADLEWGVKLYSLTHLAPTNPNLTSSQVVQLFQWQLQLTIRQLSLIPESLNSEI